MRVSVRVEGVDRLQRALAQLPRRTSRQALRHVLLTVAAPRFQVVASAMAPRAPGAPDLADQILVSAVRAPRESSAAVAIGPSTARRADQPSVTFAQQGLYVEFGTRDTPRQSFMRPAFDQEASGTLAPVAAELWRVLAGKGVSTRTAPEGGGLL